MMGFWILGVLLIAWALAFVLPPLLRRTVGDPRRAALDTARRSGVLSADEYAAKLSALGPTDAPSGIQPAARYSAFIIALLLPLTAVGLYLKLGDIRVFDTSVQSVSAAMQDAERAGLPPMEQAIAGLTERLASQPDDIEGWMLLARAYKSMERFDQARDALAQAMTRSPDTPTIMVEYAEAKALASESRRFEGESLDLLERALTLDPNNERGLWLRGIAYYQAGDRVATAATWERLLGVMSEDNPARDSIRQHLTDLHTQNGEATADASSPSATAPPDAPRLRIHVAVAPELATRIGPDDVLFVFARAAQGSRAPLAIQRLAASALPLTLELNDSHAMLPQMNLSSAVQVIVGARISRSGSAEAQPGDMEVLSEPLSSSHLETIELVVDQLVP